MSGGNGKWSSSSSEEIANITLNLVKDNKTLYKIECRVLPSLNSELLLGMSFY